MLKHSATEILSRSSLELEITEKELRNLEIKGDVMSEIYGNVFEILTDNINLRKRINHYIEAMLQQTEQKLEDEGFGLTPNDWASPETPDELVSSVQETIN